MAMLIAPPYPVVYWNGLLHEDLSWQETRLFCVGIYQRECERFPHLSLYGLCMSISPLQFIPSFVEPISTPQEQNHEKIHIALLTDLSRFHEIRNIHHQFISEGKEVHIFFLTSTQIQIGLIHNASALSPQYQPAVITSEIED